MSNVEKGRQVLTKLHQNSPYKPTLKSPVKSKETVVAKSKKVDVRIIKPGIQAPKNISTVFNTNKEARTNVADCKRNLNFKNTSKKPVWK